MHSVKKRQSVFIFLLFFFYLSPSHFSSTSDERQHSSESWFNLYLFCERRQCHLSGQVNALIHLLQMSSFKVQLFLWSLVPSAVLCRISASPGGLQSITTDSSPRNFSTHTSTAHYNPLNYPSANAVLILSYKSPSFSLVCYQSLLLPLPHPPQLSHVAPPQASLPRPLLPVSLVIRSGFSNGTQEVFVPEVLNFFTFFCSFLSNLSVSRNPT